MKCAHAPYIPPAKSIISQLLMKILCANNVNLNEVGTLHLIDTLMKILSKMTPSMKYKMTLLVFFSIWLAAVIIAPMTIPANSVTGLSGKDGVLDNQAQWSKMNPFAEAVYFVGDFFCTEVTSHSLFINGNQMPFCIRCTGIFIGLVVGMIIALMLKPRFRWWVIILGALPILIDGGLQLTTSYVSNNPLRLATGLLAGIVTSLFLSHFADVMLEPKKSSKNNDIVTKDKTEKSKKEGPMV